MRQGIISGIIAAGFGALTSTPALAHDLYTGLKDPAGRDCCGGHDCRPVDMCVTHDGKAGLLIVPPDCSVIEPHAILPLPSPDGQAHVCLGTSFDLRTSTRRYQRCVLLPGSA
jgi:hypothetical protein